MSKVKALRAKTNRVLQRLNTENKTVRAIRGAVNTRIRNPLLRANARVNDAIDDNVLKVTTMLLDKKLISPKQASRIYDAIQSNESKYPAKSISDSIARDNTRQRTLRTLGGTIPNTNTTQRLKNTITNRIANLPEPQNSTFRAKLDNINQKTKTINRLERKLAQNYRTARTAAKITPLGALIATMVASRDSDTPSKNAGVKKRALPFHSSPPSLPNTRHPVSRSGKYMTKRAIKKASSGNFTPMSSMSESDNQTPSSPFDFPFLGSKKSPAQYSMNPSAYAASQSALKNTTTSPKYSIFEPSTPESSKTSQSPVYSPQDLSDEMLGKFTEAIKQAYDAQDRITAQKQYYEDLMNAANAAREQANAYAPTQPSPYDPSNPYDTSGGIDWLNDPSYYDPSYYDPSYYQEPVQPFIPEYKLVYGSNRPAKSKTATSSPLKSFRPDGSKPK